MLDKTVYVSLEV